MESTTEILPTLVRIWERERMINLSGGNDRHIAWCHNMIYRLAMNITDEQLATLNQDLAYYKEQISRSN